MNNRLFWYLILTILVVCSSASAGENNVTAETTSSQVKESTTKYPVCPFLLQPFFSSLAKSRLEPSYFEPKELEGNSCLAEKHWQELEKRDNGAYLQNSLQEFFKQYYGPWAKLQETHPTGLLWKSMVELSAYDPLVKALMEFNTQRIKELCKSEVVRLNDLVDLPFTGIKANYLTIAFFVANSEKATRSSHAILKELLACGAHADAALYFDNEQLPLILLALGLNDKVTMMLLVDHGVNLNVSFGGHSLSQIAQGFESYFECKGYSSFLERYSNRKPSIEATAPGLALPDSPQAALSVSPENFIAELIDEALEQEKQQIEQ